MATETPVEAQKPVTADNHKKIQDYDEKVMCDFGHKFCSSSAELIPFKNSTAASLGEVLYLDEEHKARSSLNSAPQTGFLVACPVCHVIHVEGFSLIKGDEEALKTDDNVVPERKIEMGL